MGVHLFSPRAGTNQDIRFLSTLTDRSAEPSGRDTDRMDRRCVMARAEGRGSSGSRSVSIVVPTYREAANLPALAERVHAALSGSGIEWELIIADDDSDDGSDAIVAELARELPVRIETRQESPRDLSRSVLFGLARAIRSDRDHGR